MSNSFEYTWDRVISRTIKNASELWLLLHQLNNQFANSPPFGSYKYNERITKMTIKSSIICGPSVISFDKERIFLINILNPSNNSVLLSSRRLLVRLCVRVNFMHSNIYFFPQFKILSSKNELKILLCKSISFCSILYKSIPSSLTIVWISRMKSSNLSLMYEPFSIQIIILKHKF